jgi:hypothetical protein
MTRYSWLVAGLLSLSLGCGGGGNTSPNPAPSGKGGLKRIIDRSKLAGQFRQIGLAYLNASETAPPQKIADLMPYLENDAKIEKLLRDEDIVVIWGVRFGQVPNSSETILAYEKDPDDKGNRYVLMADASVKTMKDAEFKAAPKAKGNR